VDRAEVAFAVAAALHLGFQATVTVLVYPALARVGDEHWVVAHARHSRAIAPLVAVAYAALVTAGGWVLVGDPVPSSLVAVASAAACLLVTAFAAAPTHARLAQPDARLVRRLLNVDRARALLATSSLVGALVTLVG